MPHRIRTTLRNPAAIPALLGAILLLATSLRAVGADSTKDQLVKAAKALASQPGYSWDTEVKVPEGTRFRPGSSAGKVGRDGTVLVSTSRGNSKTEAVIQGEKAAVTNREGKWQSLAEVERAPGFGRFTAAMVRGIKKPAEEALQMIDGLEEISKEGDAYVGKLSEESAKELAASSGGFGRRGGRGGRRGSNVVFAKASVKFWVKDGILTKFEQSLDSSLDFNGSEVVIERTTTTTIKDIGTTKVKIPAEALAKLE